MRNRAMRPSVARSRMTRPDSLTYVNPFAGVPRRVIHLSAIRARPKQVQVQLLTFENAAPSHRARPPHRSRRPSPSMPYSLLELSVVDRVATLTINRPDKLNALNAATIGELGDAIDEIRARDDIGGAILTGAGRAFVAGADIS